jgi:ATP-dependent Clp protease adaptor protein ClpS
VTGPRESGASASTPLAPAEVEPDEQLEELGNEPVGDEDVITDKPWLVIVWNDPVNLMSYVVHVLQKLFGYSRQKATKLMLEVHHEGKSVVSHGTREKAEGDVARLHAHGLWATMQHDTP